MDTNSTANTTLDHFTPDILGVLWFTEKELGKDLQGFDEINYLFNGLISQFVYGKEINSKNHANIFFTENFKERIFLTHLKTKDLSKSQIAGDVDEHLALIKVSSEKRKKILVLDITKENWTAELKKRYPQFEFRELV